DALPAGPRQNLSDHLVVSRPTSGDSRSIRRRSVGLPGLLRTHRARRRRDRANDGVMKRSIKSLFGELMFASRLDEILLRNAAVPWWDRQAGVRYPLMTWDEVHTLHRKGFDIGGHTRTHLDLGQVDDGAAWDEIAGGRRELEKHLGAPVDLFAYPYGRRHNFS